MTEELGAISLLPPENSVDLYRNCKAKHCFASLSRRVRAQYANYGRMLAKIG